MKIIQSKGLFAMIGEEEKPHVFIDKSEEFRKCLEEIREICKKVAFSNGCDNCDGIGFYDGCLDDDCGNYACFKVLDKINEVLNEE